MKDNFAVSLSELIYGFSTALDLVSPALVNHHKQVLFFSEKLATSLNISDQEKNDICIAAMLHDIGVVAFNREIDLAFSDKSVNDHARLGYQLMKRFTPFAAAAEMVRGHHTDWSAIKQASMVAPGTLGSNIIYLADWIAVTLDIGRCVLGQADDIRRWVVAETGGMFMPDVVEAFIQESHKESFWLDAKYGVENGRLPALDVILSMGELRELSELLRAIIDYRCRHTASHSKSVAYIAEALAKLIGFSGNRSSMIFVAGNLHDLGKLSLPSSILDKSGPLTTEERNIVKSHPYHTNRILTNISGFEEICHWAALHHECPDGSGYPFRLSNDEIPLEARIISTADVFVALTENRPYRDSLPRDKCLGVMLAKAAEGKLDPLVVSLVKTHYDDLFDLRMSIHQSGIEEYQQIVIEAGTFVFDTAEPECTYWASA